jgi:uncharacterized membrane protein
MKATDIPRYIKVLLIFTFLNLAILAIRNNIVGDSTFDFLKSNLWSGVIPFIIAVGISVLDTKLNKWVFVAASLLWLLFYPNAPYMISDLIHPHEEVRDAELSQLIVHDTLIVFSIAMLSVFYGFVSLKIIFNLYLKRFGDRIAHSFIIFSLALSCLGFYMGRELVSEIKMGNGFLYSSEMFMEPVYIIKTVWKAIWPIWDNLPAWYMMILFGFVQYQLLVMMKDVSDVEEARIFTKD